MTDGTFVRLVAFIIAKVVGIENTVDRIAVTFLNRGKNSGSADNISAEQKKKNDVLAEYGKGNERVHQLIDLALLQNGMLKGEALTRFVKRSVKMIQ